ncbi:hypothetical protein [Clostridium haemolyticum]|uniref:Phage protein n=1 Tax=Clostridium haemolyticum NCTC 9693 TaxID=1443114 RepID=A0ABR4THD0_CLOHA|nr:hypothetical protein [Clostridium haemolyticum]KEI18265.1 hypothetical protein Z960_03895 [Clostridium haemolyticum NCTC 9693]KGN04190.1 hypothetical protein Z961_04375 [Clostridium haemolyticum NCTC 8350]
MRKYKTWEVIKMLEEEKAKEFKCKNFGIENVNGEFLFVENGEYAPMCGLIIGMEWELVQQPVSFMEALESGKKCWVEHRDFKYLKLCKDIDSTIKKNTEKLLKKEAIDIYEILRVLSCHCASGFFKDIIKNGKWYIEVE